MGVRAVDAPERPGGPGRGDTLYGVSRCASPRAAASGVRWWVIGPVECVGQDDHDSGEPLRRGGTMMRKAGRSRASLRGARVIAILVPILGLTGWPGRCEASNPVVATLA